MVSKKKTDRILKEVKFNSAQIFANTFSFQTLILDLFYFHSIGSMSQLEKMNWYTYRSSQVLYTF